MIAAHIALIIALAGGGSDAPTPFIVDPAGVALPVGTTFPDNGHVNIRTTDGVEAGLHFESKCITRTDAECAGARHDAAQFIGQAFIPWTAFGLDPATVCVEWVQVSMYNQHHGEGGQAPVGNGCAKAEPTPESTAPTAPPASPEPPAEVLDEVRASAITVEGELAATGLSPAASWLLIGSLLAIFAGFTGSQMRATSRASAHREVRLAPDRPARPRYKRR